MPTEPLVLPDLNVLIALTWPRHVHHERAHQWFSSIGGSRFATTPVTETGFLRLSTNASVVGRPVQVAEALAALTALRALPGHLFLPDDSSLAEPGIDVSRMTTGRQVTDVHLVALVARSGGVLATLDRSISTYLEPGDRRSVLLLP